MENTTEPYSARSIALRIVACAAIAVTASSYVALGWLNLSALMHGGEEASLAFRAGIALWGIVVGPPLIAVFVFIYASPLVAIAALLAVVLRRSIERHLLIWCFAAPAVFTVIAVLMLSLVPTDSTAAYSARLWYELRSTGVMLVPAHAVAAAAFYVLSSRAVCKQTAQTSD